MSGDGRVMGQMEVPVIQVAPRKNQAMAPALIRLVIIFATMALAPTM